MNYPAVKIIREVGSYVPKPHVFPPDPIDDYLDTLRLDDLPVAVQQQARTAYHVIVLYGEISRRELMDELCGEHDDHRTPAVKALLERGAITMTDGLYRTVNKHEERVR